MEDRYGHRISYLRVSITDRCNERCTYCMPRELQEWLPREDVLTYEETLRLIRIATELGVSKVRITGGEPLTRRDVLSFFEMLRSVPGINDLGLSTNGTLLARADCTPACTMAEALRAARVNSVNVSLDTLDREVYAQTTGRDFLPAGARWHRGRDRRGISADKIKLRSDARPERGPVRSSGGIRRGAQSDAALHRADAGEPPATFSTRTIFCRSRRCGARLESHYGPLIPEPTFRTNGPSSYYKIPGRDQRIGFIGAMSNLHFCESCNKLRLTCDGKLRPCLGSYLEFDIMKVMRAGATDAELKRFFLDVVERKPEQHDFRENYQPGRMMVAIGG